LSDQTIDELAATSRVPSRTIRFYQSKGALPPPVVRGRVAYYGPQHLERLELIRQLQDRGLRIDAIRELASRIDKGDLDVGDWLGLDAQIRTPWADDRPRTMTAAEITDKPGLIAGLVRAKLIVQQADVYLVESPALLRLVLKLEDSGVDVAIATRAAAIMRKHVARASRELADYALEKARRGEVDASLDAVRPIALDAVRLLFAREVEGVLRGLVDRGKTTKLAKKKRAG
jgi:DNA-binding transcriptional MerR regulator